jgi:hypothetical protein
MPRPENEPRKDKQPTGPAQPFDVDTPGQGDMSKIRRVDLDLDSDGISRRQDEPEQDGKEPGGD